MDVKENFVRVAMQECGIGRMKAENLWLAGMRYASHVDALQLRLNAVEEENDRLRTALKFYADKDHYYHGDDKWDKVSGEPANILWHEEEPYSVEDGWFARKALENRQ